MTTIQESMNQTKECQSMLRDLIGKCEILINEIERLKAENEQLKQKLEQKPLHLE